MMGGIMLLELEALTFPQAAIGIGLFLLGLLGIRQSRIVYTEPIPRFVIDYHGWSSTILSLPYIAGFFLSMGVGAFKPVLPGVVMNLVALVWLPCITISLLGIFFWFPRFLLPRWYRRAVKAGVPRNDPKAMGAFKALPLEQQREAAQQGNQR
jgi:hypothetical protein